MAKITGPLLSLDASGGFAKTLTFARGRAGNIAYARKPFRRVVIPAVGNQFSWRDYHSRVLLIYKNLSVGELAFLNTSGIYKNMSGYHSFMHHYLLNKPSDLGNFTLGESVLGRSEIF